MPDPKTITMVDPDGIARDVPIDAYQSALDAGFHEEAGAEKDARLVSEARGELYGGASGKAAAAIAGTLRGATFGGSDALMAAAGGGDAARHLKEANPGLSSATEIAGALITALPTGGGSLIRGGAAAAKMARAGETGSAISRIGKAGVSGAGEGALYGAGSGVSEIALSDNPLTLERAISTLSSHALYGGGIGGVAGSLGKVAEIGLTKAKGVLDDVAAKHAASSVTDDLARMDARQLDEVIKVEKESLKAANKAEAEAVEATRVTERQAIADDIAALRREIKDSEQWATTKGLKMPASAEGRMSSAELGAIGKKTDSALMRLSENPIGLAKDPRRALDALQRQEYGLTKLLEHGDELRAAYAVDGLGGKRLAALDKAPALLEKNRALQARIAEASTPFVATAESTARLEAARAAKEALLTKPGAIASIPQRMVEGSAFGTVTGLVSALPVPGAAMAAPMVGAAVSKMLGEKVFGRLSKAAADQAARTSKAVAAFIEPTRRATKAAVPVASKVLSSVRFAAEREPKPERVSTSRLADVFHERANEVRSLTVYGPTGKPEMRSEARADIAERLKGVGALSPLIADQLETIAARRVEFLASKLPRRPDIGGVQIGSDRWQPSDMEMRKWARYVAGVEDPGGIEERLADGTVSVEDAEVMREVYPERLAELTRQIVDHLPTVKVMPYEKRLALAIMTGVPVVPAMDPRILPVLQAQYASDDDQGPKAQAAFGSVKKQEPTPAQERAS